MVEAVAEIKKCEHDVEDLATYCRIHDMALCNDCYFDDHGGCGRGMTLKQASTQQISAFEGLLAETNTAYDECSSMKESVERQGGIEEEVKKKVEEEYKRLTEIVDEQRGIAQETILNLESIQNYRPPPSDFSDVTIGAMSSHLSDLQQRIEN